MALLFYSITILINIFAGVRYGKRTNPLILFLSFIIIFLLMSGYRNTSGYTNDLLYFEIEYNNIINGLGSSYEFGYILLMKIGSIFTQDFYTFRSIIIGILLLFLFKTIRKWAPSPHYVIALFCSYLVILSAIQFRYFIALVIFLIGLNILLFSNYRFKKMIFSYFILIASTIHLSFLLYFVFLLISKISRGSNKEKIIASLTFVFCFIIFLNNNQIPGLSQVLGLIDNYKAQVYLNQTTNYGFIYPFILHLSSILLSFWALKLTIKSQDNEAIPLVKNVYKINLLVVLFFPFFMLQLTFYRLARNILLVNYLIFSQIIISKKIHYTKRYLFAFLVWNSVVLWVFIDLIITTPFDGLLAPFFTENIYLNF